MPDFKDRYGPLYGLWDAEQRDAESTGVVAVEGGTSPAIGPEGRSLSGQPIDSQICALRAEYRAIHPAGDVGAYMAWLEEQVIGLRHSLIQVQAAHQALGRAYSRLSTAHEERGA